MCISVYFMPGAVPQVRPSFGIRAGEPQILRLRPVASRPHCAQDDNFKH